jgi:hypothetical protein
MLRGMCHFVKFPTSVHFRVLLFAGVRTNVGGRYKYLWTRGRAVQRKRAIDGRVGARIAELRESRGLSQGKLARAIGVTTGAVQAYAAPGAGCGPTG